ncbi:MAG: hypothetical protein ACI4UJ_05860 [Candidatus Cryptobacteroides sp.]
MIIIPASCIREEISTVEGEFVLDIVSKKMSKVTSTRAIDEQIENYIYSLYIYVSDGGKIKSIKHVSIDNPAMEYTCRLEPMSSSCVIYAVANAEFAENTFKADELASKLDKITTADQLHSIVAEYASSNISLARPQGHLLMSGTLNNPSPTNRTLMLHHIDASVKFEVAIGKDAAEKGASFEMTEYQVFNLPRKSFLYDRRGDNAECTPPASLVYGENVSGCPWDAVGRLTAEDYYSSEVLKNFSTGFDIYTAGSGQEIRRRISEFDFYMLENRKLALASTGNTYPDNYGKRDDRVSVTDRTFSYADKYATYVVIKGIFKDPEMDYDLKDEMSGTGSYIPDKVGRYAEVEYTVHLGNFDTAHNSDADAGTNNFFTDRNTRYTYKVTVLNAKDIAVEAIKDVENAPSAEGDVLDSHHAAYGDFDAHFGSMVIGVELPRNADGSLDMSYFTDPERCLVSDCPYGEDYSWIQFAPMHSGDIGEDNKTSDGKYNALSYEYCRAESRLVSMAMLPDWFLSNCSQYNSEGGHNDLSWLGLTNDTNTGNNKVWFTIFVDENYPQAGHRAEEIYKCSNHGPWGQVLFWPGFGPEETPTCAAMQGRSSIDPANPDWRSYINVPNREFRLFNDKFTSDDKASKYSLSRVYVTQRSIQSYYDVASLDASSVALGVEHWDEPGKALHRSRETDGNDGSRPVAYPVGTGIDEEDGLTASRCWFKGLSSVWNWSADGTTAYNSVQRDNSAEANKRWDHWFDLKKSNLASQFIEPASAYDAWHELLFLQRNRDINANGIIELDEIRWFNPAYYQLETISMNGNALVTPLYDRSIPATTGPGEPSDAYIRIRDKHIMWYMSSSLANIWVDEVTSGGSYVSMSITNSTPSMDIQENYMRCARNLGANAFNSCPDDPRNAVGTKVPSVYYRAEGSLSITPVNLNPRVLREPILKGELVPMNQFDKFNSISRTGFTVADMKVDEYYNPAPTMEELDKGQSPCRNYWEGSENDPKTGKGCWRTPNSLELTLMMMTKVLIPNQGWSKKAGYEYATRDGGIYSLSLMSCTKYHWSYATDDTGLKFTLLPTCDNSGNNIAGTGYVTWHASHNHHFLTYIDDHIRLSDSNYWTGITTQYWDDQPVTHRLRCVRDN